ncbi:MAG: hypothetical protein ACI8O8_000057 [Oleiphilaceae bacterium]|jgi:hypothetical protein
MLGIFLSFQVNAGFALIVRVNDSTPQYMWEDVQWTGRTVESMGVLLQDTGCKAEYLKIP